MIVTVDVMALYKERPPYTGPRLDYIIDKEIPDSKILYNTRHPNNDWHESNKERDSSPNRYAAYTLALIELELSNV